MASEAGRGTILVLTGIRLFNGASLWDHQLNHAAGADREGRHEEDEGKAPHTFLYTISALAAGLAMPASQSVNATRLPLMDRLRFDGPIAWDRGSA